MTAPRVARRPRARSFIDYSLQRRAVLQALRAGRVGTTEVCDAHPHLLRAAKFHGEQTDRVCPVCRHTAVALLRYVYSDELGQFSGRIRSAAEVVQMSTEYGEVRVYVVEVCQDCSWNHLIASYVIGDGVQRRAPRRQRTAEDEYG